MIPAAILALGVELDCVEATPALPPVTDFPEFRYAKRDVRRAGDALRGDIWWSETAADEIKDIFRIANNWRDSHAFPMQRLRVELIAQVRRSGSPGKTWARLKRMQSIRRKLRELPQNLTQIQDLGGCRAVMPDMAGVTGVIDLCQSSLPHDQHGQPNDYISNPKSDGYRCYHIVYKFRPRADDEQQFEGRRVEIQIRSQSQHSWATAVEAVGAFRNENLKAGLGSADWLRLLQLMASEIALAEGCPELQNAPPRNERVKELRDLDKKLKAVSTLENLRQAFNYVRNHITGFDPKYFLIRYDTKRETVSVDPYDTSIAGVSQLDALEQNEYINSVLVEADRIDTLAEGYPNYFGDVERFKQALINVVGGVHPNYVLAPQERVKLPPREVPDLSWFKRSRFNRPKGS